ncbi:TIGR01777 family oxidoreductase [Rubrivirga sp. IMCC45206]|uniref:TIGR01777 family oxidoreductase n=1 Tax=Rubrivirga sp. IMCC45206 TaxID=3391614 RepID=UPI00398FF8C8
MRYTTRVAVPVPAADLFRWHARPGAFQRLSPPWQPVSLVSHEGIRDGDRAVIRLGVGPAGIDWVAEHVGYDDVCLTGDGPCQFEDRQVSGPFAAWHHVHRMLPDGDGSVLEDDVTYELPLAPVTSLGAPIARRQFDRMFAYRHRVTVEDLRRHADADVAPMTIAITGASGLVGTALGAFLQGGGHTVVRLVRRREDAVSQGPQDEAVYWNVEAGEVDTDALARLAPDAVVHLAGEPITSLDGSQSARRTIWESRSKGTRLIAQSLAALPVPPRVLVSASASGAYGDRGDEVLTEDSPRGTGFLPGVCRAWENATAPASAAGIRVVHARIGLVTTPSGGVLQPLAPLALLGLGGWPGDGTAWWPWIALDDVVYALHHIVLAAGLSGPVNLSAPEPVTTKAFVKTLARVQRRPAVVSVPTPLVKLAGGELARRVALTSVRMVPGRLLASGFRFAVPDLDTALRHMLGRLDAHTLS